MLLNEVQFDVSADPNAPLTRKALKGIAGSTFGASLDVKWCSRIAVPAQIFFAFLLPAIVVPISIWFLC